MAMFLEKQNGKGLKKVRNRFGGERGSELGRREAIECGCYSSKRHLREAVAAREASRELPALPQTMQPAAPVCPITGETIPASGLVTTHTGDGKSLMTLVYRGGVVVSAHCKPAF